MKVVFDTTVFVSAFMVHGSKGEDAFLLAHRRKVELLYLSAYLDRDRACSPNKISPARAGHCSGAETGWPRGDNSPAIAKSGRT